MTIRTLILTGLLTLASAAQTQAGFTVSIGNATVAQGGTVTLDVTISGPERLDLFAGEFVLAPLNGALPGGLQFAATPPLPPLSDSNYAFAPDNSFASANLPSNPASVYTTNSLNDTYLVSDGTLDFLGVDVSGGKLLARLTLEAGNAAIGSQYQVAYGSSSIYLDENGNPVDVTFSGGVVTVTGGEGTGGGVVATPTPSGLTLAIIGGMCLLGRAFQRRRECKATS